MDVMEGASQMRNGAQQAIGKFEASRISPYEYFKANDCVTFRVKRLTNGYTVSGVGWNATYFPDIDAILRYVAESLGGPDAVPIMPVSAEEAGLMPVNATMQLHTDRGTLIRAIGMAVGKLRDTYSPVFSAEHIDREIDKIFKGVGFDGYSDYIVRETPYDDELERILDVLQMRIRERTVKIDGVTERSVNHG